MNKLSILERVIPLLCCPDDKENLHLNEGSLECDKCGRKFTVYSDNFVELLPKTRQKRVSNRKRYNYIVNNYWNEYRKLFSEKFIWNDKAIAWGASEINTEKYNMRKQKEIQIINELTQSCSGVFCDVSAGGGLFTLPYSSQFDVAINCDPSVESI